MRLKAVMWIITIIFCSIILNGCNGDTIRIEIYDGNTQTVLEARSGQTVRKLLADAEISIGNRDLISPSLDTSITASGMGIWIKRYADVRVETEERTWAVSLTGGTVQDALNEAGVQLEENDYINHSQEAYLTDGMKISVVHRMAVTLVADGKAKDCLTQAHTVQELLEEQRLTLGELDRVTPKRSADIKDGAKVVVKRVEIREIVETEPIAFETNITYSGSMLADTSQIIKEGIDGEKRVTYQVTYVDGKEESRKAVKEEIIKEAVVQEVVQGSKPRGKTVVSRQKVDDCDGSGHGFYIITYSDGSVEYQDY
ncbi:MAG: ubiquitin-like domain-containing protein [Lachnospiraceae bacterium]|nr:ubiquitin-like domain-containing protein [Lachnospiraceae bacterium]